LASVEVLRISLPQELPPELSGFSIDSPAETLEQGRLPLHPLVEEPHALANWSGSRRDGFVVHLRGWAVGKASRAVVVEVLEQEEVMRTVPIRGSRQDLARVVPDGTDAVFHALVSVLGLPLEFELQLRVVLEDGVRVPIGSVKARHSPIGSQIQPRLDPITVSCLGRSGTTLLMQVLAAHPLIVVYQRPPYESSPARYWMHMLKVLSEPGNLVENGYRHEFHENPFSIGHNPFYDDTLDDEGELGQWFARGYIERLAGFCQQGIDDWYAAVARHLGQDSPVYFVEKHMWPNYMPVLIRELYPEAKEVFLVRDFRDMACSILAFDRKRGYTGFRRPPGKTDEQYVQQNLREAALGFRDSWRSRRELGHLVRYEDLVQRPDETLASLLGYLELDSTPQAVAELQAGAPGETTAFQRHATSSSLEESIGRWQRERDERFRRLCHEAFAEALEEFGYA
jgi:sulfotransferase family protein